MALTGSIVNLHARNVDFIAEVARRLRSWSHKVISHGKHGPWIASVKTESKRPLVRNQIQEDAWEDFDIRKTAVLWAGVTEPCG